jgi:hypothetical protein
VRVVKGHSNGTFRLTHNCLFLIASDARANLLIISTLTSVIFELLRATKHLLDFYGGGDGGVVAREKESSRN